MCIVYSFAKVVQVRSIIYLWLELSTLGLFGLAIWHAAHRGRRAVVEFASAACYGVVLEWAQILIFRTYSYTDQFWFAIGPVPIVIGLCWGLIIYSAMAYSDQLGLPAWCAPFADALWAIVLDLAFDAIAIRLQFWTWTIPLRAGYFGVPAENFFAWLFVALSFSAYTRWARRQYRQPRARTILQLAAPAVSYAGIWLCTWLFRALLAAFYGPQVPAGSGMGIFVGTLALFAALVGIATWRSGLHVRSGIDLIPTLTRWAMHGYYFGWALLLTFMPSLRLPGMDLPLFLIWIALALIGVEALMLVPVLQRKTALLRQVYVLPQLRLSDMVERRVGAVTV